MLDRVQHYSQLLLISADSFVKEGESKTVFSPFILWKEEMPLSWISVSIIIIIIVAVILGHWTCTYNM